MQLLEWFLWAHLVTIVVMVEIASTISFGMLMPNLNDGFIGAGPDRFPVMLQAFAPAP